ncbi:hypothetical protein OIU78_009471 [Salix suchowensis]|nr:hypothetical protein OIU78_009471 [Salix suchowensis]
MFQHQQLRLRQQDLERHSQINSGDSGRIKQRPALAGLLMIVAAIFVFAFPAGSASMFQV